MLSIGEIRQYIANMGIAADERVYIGKLDNKKEQSIGVYPRKGDGAANITLGGAVPSYDVKRISLLIHWTRDILASEQAAVKVYETIRDSRRMQIGDTDIIMAALMVPEPVYVGTDDKGIHEYVLWVDFFYQKGA